MTENLFHFVIEEKSLDLVNHLYQCLLLLLYAFFAEQLGTIASCSLQAKGLIAAEDRLVHPL